GRPATLLPASFFFFQAEDGIRDFHVTGVQTCALPILDRRALPRAGGRVAVAGGRAQPRGRGVDAQRTRGGAGDRRRTRRGTGARSEERRVGKEGRCRWARGRARTDVTCSRGRSRE